MSVVRPEFGPTLPELLGPRLRAVPRPLRLALAAAAMVAVAAVGWMLARPPSDRNPVVVREPVAFRLVHPDALRRVPPGAGEVLRLRSAPGATTPQSLSVAPLRLSAYRGDVSVVLAMMASRLVERMRATLPRFVWRGEGRVSINQQPGYQILFQIRPQGRTTYGRRFLLVPKGAERPREGVDMTVLGARSPAVPRPEAVGADPALKTTLRSFGFGAGAW